ncbi:hypothetical protein BDZ89DRAFT_1069803 [Hymenopellis radicata]|nr:hypothetical protein BDZ89DRAFT_1069803 [Hymenopellis radicata]
MSSIDVYHDIPDIYNVDEGGFINRLRAQRKSTRNSIETDDMPELVPQSDDEDDEDIRTLIRTTNAPSIDTRATGAWAADIPILLQHATTAGPGITPVLHQWRKTWNAMFDLAWMLGFQSTNQCMAIKEQLIFIFSQLREKQIAAYPGIINQHAGWKRMRRDGWRIDVGSRHIDVSRPFLTVDEMVVDTDWM